MNGIYAIYFTGYGGSSLGILSLKDGIITGADVANGIYDGEYKYDRKHSCINGNIKVTVPQGTVFVTGLIATPPNQIINIPFSLPQDFGAEKPIEIQTPIGPINIIFKKLRDYPS